MRSNCIVPDHCLSFYFSAHKRKFYFPRGGGGGWSGAAMVLGDLPVPGRPVNLDKSKARAYCACSRCG